MLNLFPHIEGAVKSSKPHLESDLYAEILAEYYKEEERIDIEYVSDKVTYLSPVNFKEASKSRRHSWFPYKEGFSPSFVRSFLETYGSKTHKTLLDPFAGVGTTLLEGSKMGLNTFGFEVSPLSYQVARTKLTSYSPLDIETLTKAIQSFYSDPLTEIVCPPKNSTVVSYFQEPYLTALLKVKAFYQGIVNPRVQAVFKIAFLSSLEHFSTHRKAGNGVKRKTRLLSDNKIFTPIEEVRSFIVGELRKILNDIIEEPQLQPVNLILGSCLELGLYPSNVQFDAVLTSPPYANCFDYSKIYLSELWLGDYFVDSSSQKKFRQESLRSHVHATWKSRNIGYGSELVNNQVVHFLATQKLWSRHIPTMVRGYFEDMGYLLKSLKDRCTPGAPIGIVVGNSYYGALPIATDIILSMIARKHGLKVEKIIVYRNIIGSSQQFLRTEDRRFMRESLVILRKE